MHALVNLSEETYVSESGKHPSLSKAINLAGAQRMLSQKSSKEFCFVLAGLESAAYKASLKQTIARFDLVLKGLINGNKVLGIGAAPTAEIKNQLNKVSGIWADLKPIFDKVVNNQQPTAAEKIKLAKENNTLLVEMNKAVQLYVKL